MKKLFGKAKGFTLAELLIVVAIIGVLVAIAIPIFSAQLEKSRENTDIANLRSAKAAGAALLLENNENSGVYYFDAEKGTLTFDPAVISGYGRGTEKDGGCASFYMREEENYTPGHEVKGLIIQVTISDSDNDHVKLKWVDGASAPLGGLAAALVSPAHNDVDPMNSLWWKIDGTTLYIRATQQDGYTERLSTDNMGWYNDSRRASITTVIFEELISPVNVRNMFRGMTNLTTFVNWDNFDVSNMVSAWSMFYECSSLQSVDVSRWDTRNMTAFYMMFYNCTSLREVRGSRALFAGDNCGTNAAFQMFTGCSALPAIDVSGWKMSGVDTTKNMFRRCSSLSVISGINTWNLASCTNMYAMFYGCSSLTSLNLTGWNTPIVQDMGYMFTRCTLLSNISGLSSLETQSATNMSHMFDTGESYVGDGALTNATLAGISGWDVSKVEDMTCMFYSQGTNLTVLDLSAWNPERCTSFNHMFADNFKLTTVGDISGWSTGNVKTMCNMFDDCSALVSIGDISEWNTASLVDVSGLFNNCSAFAGEGGTIDLSGWNTSSVKGMAQTFMNVKASVIDLTGWTTASVTDTAWTGAGEGIYYSYGTGMSNMFSSSASLTSILVGSGWDTEGKDTRYMFSGCGVDHVTMQ